MVRSLSLALLSLLISVSPAFAESLRGRVTDPQSRPVAHAQVLIVRGTSVIATATTTADGRFGPVTLPAGDYEVSVAAPGLRSAPKKITVRGGATASVDADISLEVAALSEAVVVSAGQVDRPLSRVTDSVTVIDRSDLDARQTESAIDALRLVPGFSMVQSGGRGAITSLFPRGGESDYTLVFVDGIQLNLFGGGFDGAHIPAAGIDRIEVVRGPQSAVFGGGAIGGIVNIITRKGGTPRIGATVEGGQQGTTRFNVETSGGRGPWSWGASFERLASDGDTSFRPSINGNVFNDDYERLVGAAGIGWSDRATRRVRADVRFERDDRGNPGPYGSDPLDRYSQIDIARGETRPRGVAASAMFGDPKAVRHSMQFTWADAPSTFTTAFGPSDDRSRRTTGRYQADLERGTLGFSGGLEVVKERADNTFVTNASFEGIPVNRMLAGFFAEGRYERNTRAGVTLGVRLERIERGALASDAFGSRPNLPDDVVWSANPKVSAVWFLRGDRSSSAATGWTKIRGGAGTGIKPPTTFELGFTNNPSLKPERSRSLDFGIEHAFSRVAVVVEATGFFNQYDDLIAAVGVSIADSSNFATDNISNARASGIETGVRWLSRTGLSVRGFYTFLNTRILNVDNVPDGFPNPYSAGDWLVRRPRHTFALDVRFDRGPIHVFALINGRSRMLDLEPNFGAPTIFATGFGVVSMGASYRITRQLEGYARVSNLLDKDYEDALGYPALRRSGMVGLRVAIGR